MNTFSFPISDVDRSQLPPEDRKKSGRDFEDAVCLHLLAQYTGNPKPVAAFVNDGIVTIGEVPDIDAAVELLSEGKLEEGVALCNLILSHEPDHASALFNSGMALSDLGKLDLALERLIKVFSLSPNANTAIAIGVAHSRKSDRDKACVWLKRAVEMEPSNPYARRNLGGVLLQTGKAGEALAILEPLALENPQDQSALFAYAQALLANGLEDKADRAFVGVVNLAPHTPLADAAKEARSKIAHKGFRGKAGSGAVRMDAVLYFVDALKTFAESSNERQMAIFQEVAIVGMRGLDVNDPTQKYTLRSLPGKKLSGLHMTCYMWVGGKVFMPGTDMGFDLSREYESAVSMTKGKS
jgi:tetratricopeptide (TPR) repeat protein